ncbi:MAG: UDP-3-O-acyl-N-acetylglucosamine deacetylase [Vampirovibrionales bacterium]
MLPPSEAISPSITALLKASSDTPSWRFLSDPMILEGMGLIQGTHWRATLEYSSEGHGIEWYVWESGTQGKGSPWHFHAHVETVIHTENGVTLKALEPLGKTLSIVEHQLSAHAQLALTTGWQWHLIPITPDGSARPLLPEDAHAELPLLDGSSIPWAKLLGDVAHRHQVPPTFKQYEWHPTNLSSTPVRLGDDTHYLLVEPLTNPTSQLQLSYTMPAMAHPLLAMTRYEWHAPSQEQLMAWHQSMVQEGVGEASYPDTLTARTFGFVEDLAPIQARGLAKGVRYDNTLGLYRTLHTTHSNTLQPLRHDQEPLSHKVLDLLGDMMLLGKGHSPIRLPLKLTCCNAGHGLHVALVQQLLTWLEAGILQEVPPQEACGAVHP